MATTQAQVNPRIWLPGSPSPLLRKLSSKMATKSNLKCLLCHAGNRVGPEPKAATPKSKAPTACPLASASPLSKNNWKRKKGGGKEKRTPRHLNLPHLSPTRPLIQPVIPHRETTPKILSSSAKLSKGGQSGQNSPSWVPKPQSLLHIAVNGTGSGKKGGVSHKEGPTAPAKHCVCGSQAALLHMLSGQLSPAGLRLPETKPCSHQERKGEGGKDPTAQVLSSWPGAPKLARPQTAAAADFRGCSGALLALPLG